MIELILITIFYLITKRRNKAILLNEKIANNLRKQREDETPLKKSNVIPFPLERIKK